MRYFDSPEILEKRLIHPHIVDALNRSQRIQRKLLRYQAAALYQIAEHYNFGAARVLEIGTFAGYSASIIAQAAPMAEIETLNPVPHEVVTAEKNLQPFKNVKVIQSKSWDYFKGYYGKPFDFIFVDGDHNRIGLDLPWFNMLKTGGLMLFHDYHPTQSRIVYTALNTMLVELGRKDFDIAIVDTNQNGMVGIYRKENELWPMQTPAI